MKIRGTAAQIAEKYTTLARDASSAGDVIMAENYLQHAEHYNRIIMAAQAQNPQPIAHNGNGSEAGHAMNGAHRGPREGNGMMRDRPQPHINGEAMDAQPPQPRMQPVVTNEQPVREPQPVPTEQPVIEGDMFPETKRVAAAPVPIAADGANAEPDAGRRRRRRYPSAASREAGAEGEPVANEKPAKTKAAAAAAPTEEPQPSDEATA